MRRPPVFPTLSLFAALLSVQALQGADWKPLAPQDLALTSPKVEKTADAEAIFWEVRVYDMIRSMPYAEHHVEHYIRLKIFSDRGVNEHSTVHIPYSSARKQTLIDIRGRTIKPDGTVIEMKKDAVFDKSNVKVGRKTLFKTKSFTLPDVTPNSIIEYQWSEVFTDYLPRYNALSFQREFPIQRVTYFVKPLVHNFFNASMRWYPFNCMPPEWKPAEELRGFVSTTLTSVPAFVDEFDAPADDEIRQWVLLFYTEDEDTQPKKYWNKMGKRFNGEFEKRVKVNGDVKTLATKAVEGAQTPEEKIFKIADFCRTKIKNIYYFTAGITAEDKSSYKPKEQQNSGDTAKSLIGAPDDINYLFAAMAVAQGFEVRGVRGSSRYTASMRTDLLDPYLLRSEFVSVKVNNDWKYFDVGNPYVPSGIVDWHEESAPALLLDGKEPTVLAIPPSPPQMNATYRKATLSLTDDGSAKGHIEIKVHGLPAARLKSVLEEQSDAKRKEELEETIRQTHGDVEVSNIQVENVTDPLKPLIYRYDIDVKSYAEVTGRRLFFQPAFFEHGRAARYLSKERKYPVVFRNPFQEVDDVEFTFPEGYSLEKGEGVPALAIAKVGTLEPQLRVTKDGRKLFASRKFTWGLTGEMYFGAEAYPQLKAAWDMVHQRDQHTLALKADEPK